MLLVNILLSWRVLSQITRLFCICTDLFIKLINLGVMFLFFIGHTLPSPKVDKVADIVTLSLFIFQSWKGGKLLFFSPNTIQSSLATPSPSDFSDLVFAVPHNCAQQWLRNCSNFSFRTTVFSISDDSYCNGLGNSGPSRASGFALFSVLERKSHLLRPKTQNTIQTIESNNHTNKTLDLIF